MGRAIVREPQVFLMDEPLSNLDAKLRVSTRTQIAALQQRLGVTTVYVTHDQVEAMTMGDRVAVMKDGLLQQVDTPLALYDQPANLSSPGSSAHPRMNLLAGKTAGDGVASSTASRSRSTTRPPRHPPGSVTLGIRPESWRVAGAVRAGYPVTVAVVEDLGADAYLYATPAGVSERARRTACSRRSSRGSRVATTSSAASGLLAADPAGTCSTSMPALRLALAGERRRCGIPGRPGILRVVAVQGGQPSYKRVSKPQAQIGRDLRSQTDLRSRQVSRQ